MESRVPADPVRKLSSVAWCQPDRENVLSGTLFLKSTVGSLIAGRFPFQEEGQSFCLNDRLRKRFCRTAAEI